MVRVVGWGAAMAMHVAAALWAAVAARTAVALHGLPM
jgi:hypothetical protein